MSVCIILRAVLMGSVVLALGSPARSAELPTSNAPAPAPKIPGVGIRDPRVRVNVAATPWLAVVKLQATSGNLYTSCTGTLIAPAIVLTAAHCVYNPRTRRNFRPQSLHILVGFNRGRYLAHTVARRIETGPAFDPRHPAAARGSDWALLTLAKPLGGHKRTLPVLDKPPPVGTNVMLGGYSADHPLILTADTGCRIIGRIADRNGRVLLRDNCAGSWGVSGAPLLVQRGSRWYVAAIAVAAEMGMSSGLAALPGAAKAPMSAPADGATVETPIDAKRR